MTYYLEKYSQTLPLLLHNMEKIINIMMQIINDKPQDQNTYRVLYAYESIIINNSNSNIIIILACLRR